MDRPLQDIRSQAPAIRQQPASLAEWQPPSLPFGLNEWLERDSNSWPTGLTIRTAIADVLPGVIARFRDGLEPHHPEAFEQAMMELAVVFPNNRASDAELRARVVAYSAALEDVPSDLVLRAARLAIRRCEHFPKPAELRKLVEDDLIDRRRKLNRAMMISRLPTAPTHPNLADAQAQAQDLAAKVAAARRVSE